MQLLINYPREKSRLEYGIEVIPLYIHDELKKGTEINFAGQLINFHPDEILNLFETTIAPRLVIDVLDTLDYNPLDLSEVQYLKNLGLAVKIDDILEDHQIQFLRSEVKILSINIEKNGYGGFYIAAWVLDPIKRLWQVCPGEYSEGWFRVNDGYEKMSAEYSRLNNLKSEDLFR